MTSKVRLKDIPSTWRWCFYQHILEGQTPLAWIEDLVPELNEADRGLLNTGLNIGRANPQP